MDIPATQVLEDDDLAPTQKICFSSQTEEKVQVGTLEVGPVKFAVWKGVNKIGRHPACNICIDSVTISKEHAEIEAHLNSTMICDVGSSNKTRLNNVILRPYRMYDLEHEDVILLGDVKAVYKSNAAGKFCIPKILTPRSRIIIPDSSPDSSLSDTSMICGTQEKRKGKILDKSSFVAPSYSTKSSTSRNDRTKDVSGRSVDANENSCRKTSPSISMKNQKTAVTDISDLDTQNDFDEDCNEDNIFDATTQRTDISAPRYCTKSSTLRNDRTKDVSERSVDDNENSCRKTSPSTSMKNQKTAVTDISDLDTQNNCDEDCDLENIFDAPTQRTDISTPRHSTKSSNSRNDRTKNVSERSVDENEKSCKKTSPSTSMKSHKTAVTDISDLDTQRDFDEDCDLENIFDAPTQRTNISVPRYRTESSTSRNDRTKDVSGRSVDDNEQSCRKTSPSTSMKNHETAVTDISDLDTQKYFDEDSNEDNIFDAATQQTDISVPQSSTKSSTSRNNSTKDIVVPPVDDNEKSCEKTSPSTSMKNHETAVTDISDLDTQRDFDEDCELENIFDAPTQRTDISAPQSSTKNSTSRNDRTKNVIVPPVDDNEKSCRNTSPSTSMKNHETAITDISDLDTQRDFDEDCKKDNIFDAPTQQTDISAPQSSTKSSTSRNDSTKDVSLLTADDNEKFPTKTTPSISMKNVTIQTTAKEESMKLESFSQQSLHIDFSQSPPNLHDEDDDRMVPGMEESFNLLGSQSLSQQCWMQQKSEIVKLPGLCTSTPVRASSKTGPRHIGPPSSNRSESILSHAVETNYASRQSVTDVPTQGVPGTGLLATSDDSETDEEGTFEESSKNEKCNDKASKSPSRSVLGPGRSNNNGSMSGDDSETDEEGKFDELSKSNSDRQQAPINESTGLKGSAFTIESKTTENEVLKETAGNGSAEKSGNDSDEIFDAPTQYIDVKEKTADDISLAPTMRIPDKNVDKEECAPYDEDATPVFDLGPLDDDDADLVKEEISSKISASSSHHVNDAVQFHTSNENGTNVADHVEIDDLAPTQIISRESIEAPVDKKGSKLSETGDALPGDVSSEKSSKRNSDKSNSLNDSIEGKLNEIFDEVNDSEIEEPTQILTQNLEKILDSTQALSQSIGLTVQVQESPKKNADSKKSEVPRKSPGRRSAAPACTFLSKKAKSVTSSDTAKNMSSVDNTEKEEDKDGREKEIHSTDIVIRRNQPKREVAAEATILQKESSSQSRVIMSTQELFEGLPAVDLYGTLSRRSSNRSESPSDSEVQSVNFNNIRKSKRKSLTPIDEEPYHSINLRTPSSSRPSNVLRGSSLKKLKRRIPSNSSDDDLEFDNLKEMATNILSTKPVYSKTFAVTDKALKPIVQETAEETTKPRSKRRPPSKSAIIEPTIPSPKVTTGRTRPKRGNTMRQDEDSSLLNKDDDHTSVFQVTEKKKSKMSEKSSIKQSTEKKKSALTEMKNTGNSLAAVSLSTNMTRASSKRLLSPADDENTNVQPRKKRIAEKSGDHDPKLGRSTMVRLDYIKSPSGSPVDRKYLSVKDKTTVEAAVVKTQSAPMRTRKVQREAASVASKKIEVPQVDETGSRSRLDAPVHDNKVDFDSSNDRSTDKLATRITRTKIIPESTAASSTAKMRKSKRVTSKNSVTVDSQSGPESQEIQNILMSSGGIVETETVRFRRPTRTASAGVGKLVEGLKSSISTRSRKAPSQEDLESSVVYEMPAAKKTLENDKSKIAKGKISDETDESFGNSSAASLSNSSSEVQPTDGRGRGRRKLKITIRKNSDGNLSAKLKDDSQEVKQLDRPRRGTQRKKANQEDEMESSATSSSTTLELEGSADVLSISSKRGRGLRASPMRIKQKVLFTALSDNSLQAVVRRLGGSVVTEPSTCTVLVTERIRRTFKFLSAIALAIPVVSVDWVRDSGKAGHFLDPESYILTDPTEEAKFGFSVKESLEKATDRKLLEGWTVVLTPKIIQPPISEMKELIKVCKGKPLVRPPSAWPKHCVVVSTEDDLENARKFTTKAPKSVNVVSTEFILKGILRQELNFAEHKLKV